MTIKRFRKRDFADRFMLVLNVVALLLLGLSYLAGSVSPAQFWPLAFAAMAYPIILISIVAFLIYWAARKRWFFFMNLAFLLAKWDYVAATAKLIPSSSNSPSGIKVMSYNVRLFDKYNWSNQANAGTQIEDLILKQKPAILCIQEFYHSKNDRSKAPNKLLSNSGLKNIHLKNYFAQRDNKNDFGIATLTSYPILNEGTIVLKNSRSALTIFTDILVQTDTIRVYNVHLQSIHLGNDGYQALSEILDPEDLKDVQETKLVAGRMKSAFLKRAEQADEIALHISKSPYPVIVCGDFNDVPTSYVYQTISTKLKDAFSQAGFGFGITYVRVPFFRIDNVLFSNDFEAKSHQVHSEEFSDHLAVSATLEKTD